MAFEAVPDLNCTKTYALGGIDKKTRKPNPKQVEGFYLGFREVNSPKSKTGLAKLHIFQTRTGNHGVWGKTNLDQQLSTSLVGFMVRATFKGMMETKNNPMYTYLVEVDKDNTIDVSNLSSNTNDETEEQEDDSTAEQAFSDDEPEEENLEEEEVPADEVPPVKVTATSKANKAKVEALLGKRRNAAA